MTAHWGVEDPAAFEGPEDKKRKSFNDVASILRRRIEIADPSRAAALVHEFAEHLHRRAVSEKLTR